MFFTHSIDQRRIGIILAFGSLLWAGTYSSLAKGLTPFLSPMTLLIVSEALTAFFVVVTFGIVPLLKELAKMDAKALRVAIIVGLLNSAVAPLLWFTGLSKTTAINASMLTSAEMICLMVFGWLVLKERVTRMQIAGAMTVLMGILVINLSGEQGFGVHMGDVFVLMGAMVYAAGAVLFKRYLSHVMAELTILIRNLTGITAVLLVSMMLNYSFVTEIQAFPTDKVLLLLAFTFFSRYLNLTFFYEALDRLPVATVSLIQIGDPLAGMMFAALILGESIESYHLVGAVFIICGLLIEQLSVRSLSSFRGNIVQRFLHIRSRGVTTPAIHVMPKSV